MAMGINNHGPHLGLPEICEVRMDGLILVPQLRNPVLHLVVVVRVFEAITDDRHGGRRPAFSIVQNVEALNEWLSSEPAHSWHARVTIRGSPSVRVKFLPKMMLMTILGPDSIEVDRGNMQVARQVLH